MQLNNGPIVIEEQESWQKVTLPAERSPWLFALYSLLMLVWLVMTGFIVVGLFSRFGFAEARPIFVAVWRILLVIWLVVWLWFGRRWIWRTWQYYAASREILFINRDTLIVRRPVSILGVTDAYDMQHISPFFLDAEAPAVGFTYGTLPIRFGRGLTAGEARSLANVLNHRYFPGHQDEAPATP